MDMAAPGAGPQLARAEEALRRAPRYGAGQNAAQPACGADAFPDDSGAAELTALSERLNKWNELRTNRRHLSLEKLFRQLTMFK